MRNDTNFYQQHWTEKRLALARAQAKGHILCWRVRSRFHVSAPKDEDFRTAALSLGGRFLPASGVWSFSIWQRLAVVRVIRTIYGDVQLPSWMEME